MRLAPSRVICGVEHAGLVDAAADDLDRLLDRRGGPVAQRRLRQGERDPARLLRNGEVRRARCRW